MKLSKKQRTRLGRLIQFALHETKDRNILIPITQALKDYGTTQVETWLIDSWNEYPTIIASDGSRPRTPGGIFMQKLKDARKITHDNLPEQD